MKQLSLLAVGISLAFGVQSQTLEQALDTALQTNPSLEVASQEWMIKKSEYEAAHGNYMPELNLNSSVGYKRYESKSTEKDTDLSKVSITLSQLIWDGGNTINDIRRTNEHANAAKHAYDETKAQLAMNVIDAYANIVRFESILALLNENMTMHQEIYTKIKKRAESGIGSTADLYQAESRLLSVQKNIYTATNNLSDAKALFVRYVGQLPKDLSLSHINEQFLPKDSKAALDLAINNNQAFAVSEANINAAKYQHQQQKSTFMPHISMEVSHGWSLDKSVASQSQDETIVMLRASYNLFNGFEDSNNAKAAIQQIQKLKFARDDLARDVEQSIMQSITSIDVLTRQQESLVKMKAYTSSVVTAYEKQHTIGKRTLLDLLNSQDEAFKAESDYINTNVDLYLAKWRLINATGQTLAALNITE